MERLDVFDCSNIFIASYFTDDRGCAHENREHTLIYIHSGELEINERGKKQFYRKGIVPSCGAIIECGYRNVAKKISLTAPLC